jgi:hypothetical protein
MPKKLVDRVGKVYSRYTADTYTKILRFGIGVCFYSKNLMGGVNSRPSIIHFPQTPQVKKFSYSEQDKTVYHSNPKYWVRMV